MFVDLYQTKTRLQDCWQQFDVTIVFLQYENPIVFVSNVSTILQEIISQFRENLLELCARTTQKNKNSQLLLGVFLLCYLQCNVDVL